MLLDDKTLELHLRGLEQIATYPILTTNKVKYLLIKTSAVNLQKIKDVILYCQINAYFEKFDENYIRIWVFFSNELEAQKAKELGEFILKNSYIKGEIFPSQTFCNADNLGSPLELPLFLKHRKEDKGVFLDEKNFEIAQDQWEFLSSIKKVDFEKIKYFPKDKTKIENKNFTNSLEVCLYDSILVSTKNASASFLNSLKSLAIFENPQIKVLLNLRKPIYNIQKTIKSYEETSDFIKLPRGLWEDVKLLFKNFEIAYKLEDKRISHAQNFPKIVFDLRQEQTRAIEKLNELDFSICVAPPGFGKTLIGAKLIELRQVNTLVLVNKNMLLDQWIQRFCEYFQIRKKQIGYLGKGKNTLNNKLDIATMQSIKNSPQLIKNYSFVIVDECHHIPAVTFEQIIKQFCGKYILGLSATPNRKDGFEPILFQQLGKIAYSHRAKKVCTNKVKIVQTNFTSNADNYASLINEICTNEERNKQIISEIIANQTRSILVLTDRIEHIKLLEKLLKDEKIEHLTMHGSLNKKEQSKNMVEIQNSKLVIATTSFFGEGIDFPHLNTIVFATPISYYGRLVQYLGRIGRDGQDCLAIDFLDNKNAMLNSAFKKRKEGYKQMNYSLGRTM